MPGSNDECGRDFGSLLRRRGRSGRHDARFSAGASRNPCSRARTACGFLARLRGDTIHPSTLEFIYELGLLKEFSRARIRKRELQRPGRRRGRAACRPLASADALSFIALMPQWDFLNFVAEHARRFPSFQLRMEAEVSDLVFDRDASADPGENRGRRAQGKRRYGRRRRRPPFDSAQQGRPREHRYRRPDGCALDAAVAQPSDPEQTFGRVDTGRIFVMINREEYWQCALVIPKGGFERSGHGACQPCAMKSPKLAPYLRDRLRAKGLVRRQIIKRSGGSPAGRGTGPGFYVSAMPRMRCRRSAGSELTSPCRMRLLRPISSRPPFAEARFLTATWLPCSGAGSFPPVRRSGSSSSCKTG